MSENYLNVSRELNRFFLSLQLIHIVVILFEEQHIFEIPKMIFHSKLVITISNSKSVDKTYSNTK